MGVIQPFSLQLELDHQRVYFKEIQAENCGISEVKQGAFRGQNLVRVLNLARNTIKVLRPGNFAQLGKLEQLNLTGNLIHIVKKDAFLGLVKLKELSISSNKIEQLEDECLRGIESLELLDLQRNRMKTIQKEAVDDIYIDTLNLGYNEISYLDLNFIPVRCLLLSFNPIQQFSCLGSFVEELQLDNTLMNISDIITSRELVSLNFASNRITKLEEDFLERFSFLKVLNLSNNLIRNFTLPGETPAVNLLRLDLSFNPVKQFDFDNVAILAPILEYVILKCRGCLSCSFKREAENFSKLSGVHVEMDDFCGQLEEANTPGLPDGAASFKPLEVTSL